MRNPELWLAEAPGRPGRPGCGGASLDCGAPGGAPEALERAGGGTDDIWGRKRLGLRAESGDLSPRSPGDWSLLRFCEAELRELRAELRRLLVVSERCDRQRCLLQGGLGLAEWQKRFFMTANPDSSCMAHGGSAALSSFLGDATTGRRTIGGFRFYK